MNKHSPIHLERRDAVIPTVFYDGDCPLCKREITHYQKCRGAENLLWVDVANDTSTLELYGLDRERAMQRFHVLDAMGKWQTGSYGFAEMWSHLAAYRWLAILLRKGRLLPLMDVLYGSFARWRLKRRCTSGHCSTGN